MGSHGKSWKSWEIRNRGSAEREAVPGDSEAHSRGVKHRLPLVRHAAAGLAGTREDRLLGDVDDEHVVAATGHSVHGPRAAEIRSSNLLKDP